MCCKLTEIRSLDKPSGKWCIHAMPGRGCRTYPDRPHDCSAFFCDWMLNPSLGPEWKPDKSRFLSMIGGDGVIAVLVDPASPSSWRAAPYYERIKLIAAQAFARGGLLTVHVGRRVIVVLSDQEIDAGIVPDGYVLRLNARRENGRAIYETIVEPA